MAYRLFTLYALYQLDRDPGHIRSVRPLMDDFVKQASLARDRIGHEMAPSTHFKINCTIVGQTRYTCRGLRDGQPITPLYEAPPLINGRDAHDVMREAIRRSWAPITEPLQRQADDFLKSANTSIKYAIQARSCVREREPERTGARLRRADAAAGEPAAHHHPLLARAEPAARYGRRALGAADRAQFALQLDQVHRRGRPGDRLDARRASAAKGPCACATPATA